MTETTGAARLPHQASDTLQGRMPEGLPLRALPLFFFLHVPKTAGTSLKQVFGRMFGEFWFHFNPGLHEPAPAKGREAAWRSPGFYDRHLMIGGHAALEHPMVREAQGRRKIFVATLRDPVDRVVSHYDFIRRQPQHQLHAELREKSLLEAFEGSERFRRASVNEQLRFVFGSRELKGVEAALASRNYIIGRVEDLDPLLDTLAAVSGIPRPPAIPRANTREERSPISLPPAHGQPDYEEAREAIRVANANEAIFMRERLSGILTTQAIPAFPARRPQGTQPATVTAGQVPAGKAA